MAGAPVPVLDKRLDQLEAWIAARESEFLAPSPDGPARVVEISWLIRNEIRALAALPLTQCQRERLELLVRRERARTPA
jgi:hypothetical protein